MTKIIESMYSEGPVQQDGRRVVNEFHIDSAGRIYEYDWLGTQNADAVLDARRDHLNEQLAARDAVSALAAGTRLPFTVVEFRDLFTRAEIQGIDKFNATFESNEALPNNIKDAIRTGLEDYRRATQIPRPFNPKVRAMLELYSGFGLLTAARVEEILAAGNG